MEQHIVQPLHGVLSALDALQLKKTLCGLVAQQQGGKGADAHFQVVFGGGIGQLAAAVCKSDAEGAVVPGQKSVLNLRLDAAASGAGTSSTSSRPQIRFRQGLFKRSLQALAAIRRT